MQYLKVSSWKVELKKVICSLGYFFLCHMIEFACAAFTRLNVYTRVLDHVDAVARCKTGTLKF